MIDNKLYIKLYTREEKTKCIKTQENLGLSELNFVIDAKMKDNE